MLLERVTELQERMLDGLADSQRRVIDANEKLAERVKGRVPAVPFADRLPKPEEWIAVSYGFWGRWLNANRSFAENLARVWAPEDETATPTSSATPARAATVATPAAPVATVATAEATTTRPRARKTATSVRKAPARKTAAKKAAPAKRAPAKRATKASGTRSTSAS
jgi:hypothetical protein